MIGYWLLAACAGGDLACRAVVARACPRRALNSVGYGLFGAAAALVLAAPIGYLAIRFPSRWTVADGARRLSGAGRAGDRRGAGADLPHGAVGPPPVSERRRFWSFAYAILFLPLALVSVRATLAQIPPGLEEAGALARPERRVGRLARRRAPGRDHGLGAGAALVFIFVVDRIDGDAAARPDRDADAGDGSLGQYVVAGLCGGGAIRRADALSVACCHLAASPIGLSRAAFAGWG